MKIIEKIHEKGLELDRLRIESKASEVVYRQKGEYHTADRLEKISEQLSIVVDLLKVTERI